MEKFKAWLPILIFIIPIIGGWYTLSADAKNLKEKVVKTEIKIEELSKEDKEQMLKQVEIDTRQSVLLESMYKLQEKINEELQERNRRPR